MPRNIGLPWMLNSKSDILVNAGPFAAFLGLAVPRGWSPVLRPASVGATGLAFVGATWAMIERAVPDNGSQLSAVFSCSALSG